MGKEKRTTGPVLKIASTILKHLESGLQTKNSRCQMQAILPKIYSTESQTMQRTSPSSSLEERLADKTRWCHFNPRTEWHEWQKIVCDEDIDAVLAARRAKIVNWASGNKSTIPRCIG